MPQLPPYDYKVLCSEFIKKLLPILGIDAVTQTIHAIPELELTPDGLLKQIHGDPQLAFEKLVHEFNELSPYVVNFLTHELHVEHEKKYAVSNQ